MSASLTTQIRDYYTYVDEQQGAVDITAVREHRFSTEPIQLVGPVAPPVEPRQRRWRPIAVAVAAVVVLVGGMALLFQVTEPETPVVGTVVPPTLTEPPPTNVAPTTPTESSPTTVAESDVTSSRWCEAPSTWTRVCDDAAGLGGAVMLSVTAGGPGFVAVGVAGVFDDESEVGVAVWTSPDGFTWSRVPHDESVFGGAGAQQMFGVTVGGPGLVAVGASGDDAAVWTSPDGFTWSRVPHDEAIFGGDGEQGMVSLTVGGPGLVAVGGDGVDYDDEGGDLRAVDAAVWTSPDGFTWSRVPHDESVFGGDGEQSMSDVTVGGPGLVAVGSDGIGARLLAASDGVLPDAGDDAVAAVWTSVDGFTWSRVPHDESVFGGDVVQAMFSVTVGGPGLVAVGATGGIDTGIGIGGAVWTSVDGFTWSRVSHDPAVFGGSSGGLSQVWMASVTAGGPGLVAVGSSGEVQWTKEEAVWTSPDGITWTRLPQSQHGCYAEMGSVTDGISGLVAVGYAQFCGPGTAAIWHD